MNKLVDLFVSQLYLFSIGRMATENYIRPFQKIGENDETLLKGFKVIPEEKHQP